MPTAGASGNVRSTMHFNQIAGPIRSSGRYSPQVKNSGMVVRKTGAKEHHSPVASVHTIATGGAWPSGTRSVLVRDSRSLSSSFIGPLARPSFLPALGDGH